MTAEQYGRSPLLDSLPALRAWNKLLQEERVKAAAAFVRARLKATEEQKDREDDG